MKTSPYIPALRFRWLTPAYDVVVRLTTRERRFKVELMRQAGVEDGHRVLDLACGTGTLAILLKREAPGASVFGIDGDPDVLAIAARKSREARLPVQFDRGSSIELPYAANFFDRVLSSLFFHHLAPAEKRRTAAEIHRVMKPGGELHVADWGKPSGPAMGAAFWAVRLLDGLENTRDHASGALPEYFREAGFTRVSETRSFGTPCGTLTLLSAIRS